MAVAATAEALAATVTAIQATIRATRTQATRTEFIPAITVCIGITVGSVFHRCEESGDAAKRRRCLFAITDLTKLL